MSIGDFIYRVIIYPLELLFEVVFSMAERYLHNPTISIIVLSLVVNFLVLPMYKRADVMQAEEREKEKALDKWTKHIKATFKGDERFMMLQTYYRQENYKQLYVLKSSIPLLLQVPFFMAAYNFLSNLSYLDGVSLGPIKNLAEPDALIVIGALSINFLPILMTTINIISGAIYSKGFPIKTKIQMYGIALVFLVLLYDSPAGLVFYWTLNNVFSLGKNIVVALYTKYKKPEVKAPKAKRDITDKSDTLVFILSTVCMAFYIGFVMPIEVISRCPQEYVIITDYVNPMSMLLYSFATAIGVFIVWFGVFYFLAKDRTKAIYSLCSTAFLAMAVLNSLEVSYTGLSMGTEFEFTKPFHWTVMDKVLNVVFILITLAVVYVIWRYKRKAFTYVFITLLLASGVMAYRYYSVIDREIGDKYYLGDNYVVAGDITLSRDGQNVVVIMMDRAIGTYYPYIMDNDPSLAAKFEGFTYYANTLSYGQNTIFGASALYGGPDYSCIKFNAREDESIASQWDEALLVMPTIFKNNGYNVTVMDPTYAGYKWIPNLTVFEENGIDAYITKGAFVEDVYPNYGITSETAALKQRRNLFCYCMTRCMPTFSVDFFYDGGDYYAAEYGDQPLDLVDSFSRNYFEARSTLLNLKTMTKIVDDATNNFMLMSNDTTHCVMLQGEDFKKYEVTDNAGNVLPIGDVTSAGAYQINIQSYRDLAVWLDYLRANGVYDNTRIIIVADHGYYLDQVDSMITDSGVDLMAISPLLIVKDFNSHESTTDNMFITNAAVPYFATMDLIDNPINPFTKNPISLDYLSETQYVYISTSIMPHTNLGNQFKGGKWYEVVGDSFANYDMIPVNKPWKNQ